LSARSLARAKRSRVGSMGPGPGAVCRFDEMDCQTAARLPVA
jgi:hypothetical protein